MKITYFNSPLEFREWLDANHATAKDLWVGYHKKASGRPSMTWPESVDEALCVGWIDGVRKNVDEVRYTIRFSARKARSTWSAVNIERTRELIAQRRMHPIGLRAFEARTENRSGIYSYEQRPVELDGTYERKLKRNKAA